jgi:DNA-directed RNA polymerase subunit M/transcription elongation factor TFIIS
MAAIKKSEAEQALYDILSPEKEQVNSRIDGQTCPRCQGGRVYYNLHKVRRGYETHKACLDCWHEW